MAKVKVVLAPALVDAFGVVCAEFIENPPRETLNTLMQTAIGLVLPSIDEQVAEIEAAAKVPAVERHTHYHPPNGSVLAAVGDVVNISPWVPGDQERDGQDVIAMLTMSGELGGRQLGETSTQYLRRILDFVGTIVPDGFALPITPEDARKAWEQHSAQTRSKPTEGPAAAGFGD